MANQPCNKCGSSDAVQKYSDGSFCFSCHFKEFKFKRKDKVIIEDETEYPTSRFVSLLPCKPFDENYTRLYIWASKYGIENSNDICYIRQVELYSRNLKKWYTLENVIQFTIRDLNNDVIGYEYRCFDGNRKTISDYPTGSVFHTSNTKSTWRVITEDIASAIKVSRVCSALALLGTSLPRKPSEKLMNILALGEKFIIWLDGDKPGQAAAKKLMMNLQQFAPCVNIVTEKDPKCYTHKEIQEILKCHP